MSRVLLGRGGGGVIHPHFQHRVVPGNGLQAILPQVTPHTQDIRTFGDVLPGVQYPPPLHHLAAVLLH